ncbi:hypothetical protein SBK12_001194 [Escherichia coli]|uniref:hypothetical protein n=1 Tax=Escherichia coli TaxID=562 RepID=UPI0015F2A5CC|nr:hypothetical protein [Escherichia coli]EEC7512592.1 hypothetical protein [Escherichia coli]EED0016107.1 hypothetical protein [Escherichia coli]EED0380775.1 hypothetical protein [Escherichia coli]EED1000299.1 hypothetical protein [Escherichia coli]EED1076836.1 hypothetical protein [Escherichia coli]
MSNFQALLFVLYPRLYPIEKIENKNSAIAAIGATTQHSDSITRNANSYFSAFTNAAHSNRAAFFFPATSILFCVPAPDFAMFFCPAH